MEKYRISLHTVSGRDIVLNLPVSEYQKFVECANNDSWFTYFESESLSYAINMDHIVYIRTSKELLGGGTMNNFECCHYCKPPKRTPACHGTCPEYLDAKAMFEQKKKERDKYRDAEMYLNHSVMERKNIAAKRKKKNAGYRRLTNSD